MGDDAVARDAAGGEGRVEEDGGRHPMMRSRLTSVEDGMATRQHLLTKVALVVIAVTIWSIEAPARADTVITLSPRPGVMQMFLLWDPSPSDPQVVLLIFPGGGGNIGFEAINGYVVARTGYLFSRQRDLVQRPEVAVAVITAPSD